jgi:RimJ/RimL family protein N-acetyltransferase
MQSAEFQKNFSDSLDRRFRITPLYWRDMPTLYRQLRQEHGYFPFFHQGRAPLWLNILRFLRLIQRRDVYCRALRDRLGCVIAWAILLNRDHLAPRTAEIGFYVDHAYRQQKLGLCLAQMIAHWGWENWGLIGLYAHCEPDGLASRKILSRLGLEPIAGVPAPLFADHQGRVRPALILQTTPERFAVAMKNLDLAKLKTIICASAHH